MTPSTAAAVANSPGRVLAASLVGTTIEFFDFYIYATAAVLVFPKLFFPESSESAAMLQSLATFAVAFIARPVGSALFGHYGDRIGRKATLVAALLTMGLSTVAIGLLPTHDRIGLAAPALLALCRFGQGLGLGGEWGGAVLLVTDHSPNRSRGFWGSFPQAGIPMGNLLATIVLLLLSATLSEGEFLAWGWRVGFWLSVIIVGVGYYIRTKVSDSPIFEAAKAEAEQRADAGYGVAEVFRHYPRGVFTAMGLRVAENILYYMVVTFSITYLAHIGVDTTEILALLFCAHLLHIVLIPSIGRLADRIGRKPVYIAGAALTIAWPFVAFPLFDTGRAPVILAGIMIGMAVHALMYAPQPAILTEMFPTRMRYSGVSLGYQVTAIFAGSWAPLIGAALLRAYDAWQPIAFYVAGAGAISLISALIMTETRGISLLAIDRADRERTA